LATEPFSEAHFATFPQALVEPCILAATSQKGCCPACGAPWARVIESERKLTRPGKGSKIYVDPEGSPYKEHGGSVIGNRDPKRHCTETTTAGWLPTCDCPNPDPDRAHNRTQPAVVLDPFLGSGMTAAVAKRLCRDYVGIELNEDYRPLIEKRLRVRRRIKFAF